VRIRRQAALQHLRLFLCSLSALVFAGAIAELLSVKHYGDRVQLIPFAMCGIGLALLLLFWWRPGPGVLKVMRVMMGLIALSSLMGVYEHIEGNLGFAREVHLHADRMALLNAALTGRDPLMAPEILAVAATIAIAASYAAPSQMLHAVDQLSAVTERPERVREASPSSTG
jgi:hypothetical protein